MAKTLNFNNTKKQYLTVILPDEKKTTLLVGTPKKAIFDELVAMQSVIESNSLTADVLDDLYNIVAKILSANKLGKVITKEAVSELFDYEDITLFILSYTDFISEVANSKN